MRYCEGCDIEHTNVHCPRCGRTNTPQREPVAAHEEVARHSTFVSDPSDSLDTMVEEASRPSLATLIKRGISNGLIQPVHDYASKRP